VRDSPPGDLPVLLGMLSRLFLVWFAVLSTVSHGSEPVVIPAGDVAGGVQPQIAVTESGTVHAVFGVGDAVFHTSSKDGHSFSTPVRVGEMEKLALKMRRGPRVVATDALVTVTAISHTRGELRGWSSQDAGKSWTDLGPLNTAEKSAREGLHAMAGDSKGLVALVWLDLRSGGMELWGRVSSDGGKTWNAEKRIYASPDGHICECCHPSVAIGPKGEIAAMWRNWVGGSRDMWTAVSTDRGQTFSDARKLGSGTWPLKGCPMDGGALAFDRNGQLTSIWRRENTVYRAVIDAPETEISGPAMQPVIVRVGADLIAAFEKDGEVMLARNGEKPTSIGKGRWPALAANSAGVCYIAWEATDGKMLVQRVP
jgi:hypothetical protein